MHHTIERLGGGKHIDATGAVQTQQLAAARGDQRVNRTQTFSKNPHAYYSTRRSSWVKQHWKSTTVLIASELGKETGEDSWPCRTGVPGGRATTVKEE